MEWEQCYGKTVGFMRVCGKMESSMDMANTTQIIFSMKVILKMGNLICKGYTHGRMAATTTDSTRWGERKDMGNIGFKTVKYMKGSGGLGSNAGRVK